MLSGCSKIKPLQPPAPGARAVSRSFPAPNENADNSPPPSAIRPKATIPISGDCTYRRKVVPLDAKQKKMRLSELKTGESATIVKVMGHGGFRRRIMEMGFVC